MHKIVPDARHEGRFNRELRTMGCPADDEHGLEAQSQPDAGTVLAGFLARLRRRRQDIADALSGDSLRVLLNLVDEAPTSHRVVFTAGGNVALLLPANLAAPFVPHIEFRCTLVELCAFVRGTAALQGAHTVLMVAHVDLAPYEPIRRLVGEELRVMSVEESVCERIRLEDEPEA